MTYRDEELQYHDNELFIIHFAYKYGKLTDVELDIEEKLLEKARRKGLLGGIKK